MVNTQRSNKALTASLSSMEIIPARKSDLTLSHRPLYALSMPMVTARWSNTYYFIHAVRYVAQSKVHTGAVAFFSWQKRERKKTTQQLSENHCVARVNVVRSRLFAAWRINDTNFKQNRSKRSMNMAHPLESRLWAWVLHKVRGR